MKLYVHQFGKHRLRCQFEDAESAKALWDEFVPSVLRYVFEVKNFSENTEIPRINGQGFMFRKKLLTAFGEKFDVVVVDSEGMKQLANRIAPKQSENPN